MNLHFYDQHGNPVAYTENSALYFYSGQPIAYIEGNAVYTFSGQHIGWYEHGWIADKQGCYILFSEQSTGGMMCPRTEMKPWKQMRQPLPLRDKPKMHGVKPIFSLIWSKLPPREFFCCR